MLHVCRAYAERCRHTPTSADIPEACDTHTALTGLISGAERPPINSPPLQENQRGHKRQTENSGYEKSASSVSSAKIGDSDRWIRRILSINPGTVS